MTETLQQPRPGKAGAVHADLVLHNGRVMTLDDADRIVDAVAVAGERIVGLGKSDDMLSMAAPGARIVDLRGRTAMPGLIDGHAHADREGLKYVLPHLSDARSIADIQERVAQEVARARPGQWITFNPLGEPPEFGGIPGSLREGRMPNRWDLDRASPENPVYIKAPWGYWPYKTPLLSVANSAALAASGIDRSTASPSPLVTIDKDPVSGEPTGVFLEETTEPIVEFSLLAAAPNFTLAQRAEALVRSMREYASVGTTSIFEGHGVSQDVVAAYQLLRNMGTQTIRAHLVFSPSWGSTNETDVPLMINSWAQWLGRRGIGDHWLRIADLYTEVNVSPETRLRRQMPVQTGWAGYNSDSGLSRRGVLELMKEAARNDIRISGIWPNLLDLFKEVDKDIPLAGRRWVLSHQSALSDEQVRLVRDMGVVISTHTNRHIYKRGAALRWRIGADKENTIVPIRTLLDNRIPVAFGSDGLPPSLFGPIWHAVERIDRETGNVIAPAQRISRLEALRCATRGGAYLTFEENEKGSIEPGKLADIVVLTADPLKVEAGQLAGISADLTIVGGKPVYDRSADQPHRRP